jgi:hypothetical protein
MPRYDTYMRQLPFNKSWLNKQKELADHTLCLSTHYLACILHVYHYIHMNLYEILTIVRKKHIGPPVDEQKELPARSGPLTLDCLVQSRKVYSWSPVFSSVTPHQNQYDSGVLAASMASTSRLRQQHAMKTSILVNCPWGSARSCHMAPVHFRLLSLFKSGDLLLCTFYTFIFLNFTDNGKTFHSILFVSWKSQAKLTRNISGCIA